MFFVSVASKGFSYATSPLESTLVKPRGSVDSKASYVRLSCPITGADSTRFSAAELSGDWTKKEKREQAPALHMEFSTSLIIARNGGKSRASFGSLSILTGDKALRGMGIGGMGKKKAFTQRAQRAQRTRRKAGTEADRWQRRVLRLPMVAQDAHPYRMRRALRRGRVRFRRANQMGCQTS